MKKIFFCYVFSLCFFITRSQSVVTGTIYTDSTLTTTISNVKIVFKSLEEKVKCVKSDRNGFFTVSLPKRETRYTVLVEKKGYIPITIESSLVGKQNAQVYMVVMLKKEFSLHDEKYDGISELISIEEK